VPNVPAASNPLITVPVTVTVAGAAAAGAAIAIAAAPTVIIFNIVIPLSS
jgi:acetyl-CoA carboxylase alpha subunit